RTGATATAPSRFSDARSGAPIRSADSNGTEVTRFRTCARQAEAQTEAETEAETKGEAKAEGKDGGGAGRRGAGCGGQTKTEAKAKGESEAGGQGCSQARASRREARRRPTEAVAGTDRAVEIGSRS